MLLPIITFWLGIMVGLAVMGFHKPHHIQAVKDQLGDRWRNAGKLEKVGLFLMFAPIPGPQDEIIGGLILAFVALRKRWQRRRAEQSAWLDQQFDEDTCSTHGVWCCPHCFDMSTSGVGWPD